MTEDRDLGRAQGDPGEANRGLGQEMVGNPSPGPRQRPLDPAAGGPGSGTGEARSSPADDGAPSTEEERAIRDQGLPQND